jgi:hypothetical protein
MKINIGQKLKQPLNESYSMVVTLTSHFDIDNVFFRIERISYFQINWKINNKNVFRNCIYNQNLRLCSCSCWTRCLMVALVSVLYLFSLRCSHFIEIVHELYGQPSYIEFIGILYFYLVRLINIGYLLFVVLNFF